MPAFALPAPPSFGGVPPQAPDRAQEREDKIERMKDEFGSKDKLVTEVLTALKPFAGKEEGLEARLKKQSNTKLFKLLANAKRATELGGKDAVVEAVYTQWSTSKKVDTNLKASIAGRPVTELLSYLVAAKKPSAKKPRAEK